jgi:hypothetical protein
MGGIAIAFAAMQPAGTTQPRNGSSDNKLIIDGLLGVSQVINRKSLIQLNYSISQSSGYLINAYTVLSVVDAVTGRLLIEDAIAGLPLVFYENRPDS